SGKGVEVLRVVGELQGHEVVRQQNGIEVESIQGSAVVGGDLRSVSGDPDPSDKSLVARLHGRFDHSTGAERRVPFDRIGEVVELPEGDVVDPEPVAGTMTVLA